jgi:hypothetical protein
MFFYDYFRKEKFNDKKPYIGEWQTIKRRKQKSTNNDLQNTI